MADISPIKEYSRQANQRRPDGGPTYRQLPPHRLKPDPRSPDQVKDATIVLGVPKDEFTPRVHEAMTLVFNEMDSLRWELEVAPRNGTGSILHWTSMSQRSSQIGALFTAI